MGCGKRIVTRDGALAAELTAPSNAAARTAQTRNPVRIGSLKGKVPPLPPGLFDPMGDDDLRD